MIKGGADLSTMFSSVPSSDAYICSTLRNVEVAANVGIYAWERFPQRPTRLLVNVEMFSRVQDPGRLADNFIDYDPVIKALRGWKDRPHVELLETLAQELVACCFENPKVEACRIRLLKPDIFNDAEAAGIELFCPRPGPA